MRIYFDTEFEDTGSEIRLISLGMISALGAELYLENSEIDHGTLGPWLQQHVVPHLLGGEHAMTRDHMRARVVHFVQNAGPGRLEFWARYGAYDWVALCQLFGRLLDLPVEWPKTYLEIKQVEIGAGVSGADLPLQDHGQHNALEDARWNRQVHIWLRNAGGSHS